MIVIKNKEYRPDPDPLNIATHLYAKFGEQDEFFAATIGREIDFKSNRSYILSFVELAKSKMKDKYLQLKYLRFVGKEEVFVFMDEFKLINDSNTTASAGPISPFLDCAADTITIGKKKNTLEAQNQMIKTIKKVKNELT